MTQPNEPHWDGYTGPRLAARVLVTLAALIGGLGLLIGLLMLAEDGRRTKGLIITGSAIATAGILYCAAVVLRWLAALYELVANSARNRAHPPT